MAVLVLDGHSRAAVETVQSLARHAVVVDVASSVKECAAFWSKYPRNKILQPTVTESIEFLAWLRELDREHKYELVLPCTETSLLGMQALPENDLLRKKALLPPESSLRVALNKQETLVLAASLGIAVPRTRLLQIGEHSSAPPEFPVVLKPVQSKLMVGGEIVTPAVEIVRHQAQWERWLERWLPLTLVQEQQYVAGRGVGVELLYRDGRKIWNFVHERIHEFPLTGGASSYRRSLPPTHPAEALASKLLDRLRWHGVAMVEFKQCAQGNLWLMEINPRLWGSLALSIDSGVDFPFGLLQIARTETPLPQRRYRVPYYTRDLLTDVQWMKANMGADRGDQLLLTRSRFVSMCEYLRPLLGVESWDHFDISDLGITFQILKKILLAFGFGFLQRRIQQRRWERAARLHHRAVLGLAQNGTKPSTILFVCHGNVCRSPLAEKLARRRLSGVRCESAGFDGKAERRSPSHMIKAAASAGVDLDANEPRRLGADDIARADLVLVMDAENFEEMKLRFPDAMPKTTLLGLFGKPQNFRIRDPYFGSPTDAFQVAEQVRTCVDGLAQTINAKS